MRVDGFRRSWEVADITSLEAALAWRDDRGGAIFWLCPDDPSYPKMGIRVSGGVADVHYFPQDGLPASRCLGGDGLLEDGMTTFVYEGADPASGEEMPNEFVVPFEIARFLAAEFFRSERMSDAITWFEL